MTCNYRDHGLEMNNGRKACCPTETPCRELGTYSVGQLCFKKLSYMPKKTRHILLTSDRIDLQRVWDRILATDTPSVHYKYEMLGFILYANSPHGHKSYHADYHGKEYWVITNAMRMEFRRHDGQDELYRLILNSGIIERIQVNDNGLSIYPVAYDYQKGSINTLVIPSIHYKRVFSIEEKMKARGAKANASRTIISLELPEGETDAFTAMTHTPGLVTRLSAKYPRHHNLDTQLRNAVKAIEDLIAGNFRAVRKYRSRCYTTLCQIPHECHGWIRINGEVPMVIDQHCTYMTLLPAIMRQERRKIELKQEDYVIMPDGNTQKYTLCTQQEIDASSIAFSEEIARLYELVSSDGDIYHKIDQEADKNTTAGSIIRNELKREVSAYMSQSTHPETVDTRYPRISRFFDRFPMIKTRLFTMRFIGRTACRLQALESSLFADASTFLNRYGRHTMVKHDSIFCTAIDYRDVYMVLHYRFAKAGVPLRINVEHPTMDTGVLQTTGRPRTITATMLKEAFTSVYPDGLDEYQEQDRTAVHFRAIEDVFGEPPRRIRLTANGLWEADFIIRNQLGKSTRYRHKWSDKGQPDVEIISHFVSHFAGLDVNFMVSR